MGLVKHIIQMVKWIPVIFISAIVLWSYYVYVIQLCILTIDSMLQKITYLLIFHILFIMFTWSYIKTIITYPNIPSNKYYLTDNQIISYNNADLVEKVTIMKTLSAKLPVNCKNIDGNPRFCVKCYCFKPDRAHHCSACGKCILKMDHHCPWVNNCVNFSNYKFFVLFLSYALIYCLWIGISSLQYFIVFWKGMVDSSNTDGSTIQIVFVTLVGFMFSISIVSLLSYHLYLVSKNKSTLESFQVPVFKNGHKDKKAYDMGCKPNFVQVFGERYIPALLPIKTSLGDGETFNMNTAAEAYVSRCYQSTDDIENVNSESIRASNLSSVIHAQGTPKTSHGNGEIFPVRQVEEVGQGLLIQSFKESSDSEQ